MGVRLRGWDWEHRESRWEQVEEEGERSGPVGEPGIFGDGGAKNWEQRDAPFLASF